MSYISGAGGVNPSGRKPKADRAKQQRQQARLISSKTSANAIRGKNVTSIPKNEFQELSKKAQKRGIRQGKDSASTEEGIESTSESAGLEAGSGKKRNPELEKHLLIALKSSIKEGDTPEEILAKVLKLFPDETLANDAFEFLLDTTGGELGLAILEARNLLQERFPREITAGYNIMAVSQDERFAKLGEPHKLRKAYREVTGKESTVVSLYNELKELYSNYDQKVDMINFFLSSLGSDLRSKGPSIDRPLLRQLITEVKSLQGILGVYRFFESRMGLIEKLFDKNNLIMPPTITHEELTDTFVSLFGERYLTMEKVMQLSARLGLSEEAVAKVIILSTMRDAIRAISPRFFKSTTQFQDFISAFVSALEELEDELAEEEEEYFSIDDLNVDEDNWQ